MVFNSAVFTLIASATAAQANTISSETIVLIPRASESTETGIHNYLGYVPSISWVTVCMVIYIVIAIGLTWRYFKQRAKYMLAMIIGLYFFIGGVAARYPYRNHLDSLSLHVVQQSLLVLSPCAFIASVYSVLGRLSGSVGGEEYMLVTPRRVTKIFVLSDVITFLIQGGGAGLVTNDNLNVAKAGEKIFLVGLILQLISFIFFTLMFIRWIVLVRSRAPSIWNRDIRETWKNDWRTLGIALGISCVCITIRCFYRVIELSQGFHGELATVEWYFYILDALPLAIATGIFIPFWPELFFPDDGAFNNLPLSSVDSYSRAK